MQTDVALSDVRLAFRMRELARALNLSVRSVWALTKAGVIPHVRVGGSILYPVDSIRQWLQQQAKGQQETAHAQASGEPASIQG